MAGTNGCWFCLHYDRGKRTRVGPDCIQCVRFPRVRPRPDYFDDIREKRLCCRNCKHWVKNPPDRRGIAIYGLCKMSGKKNKYGSDMPCRKFERRQ